MENGKTEKTGPSLLARGLALIILAVAALILFKVVVGLIAGVFWILVVIVAAIAILWAWRTLSS